MEGWRGGRRDGFIFFAFDKYLQVLNVMPAERGEVRMMDGALVRLQSWFVLPAVTPSFTLKLLNELGPREGCSARRLRASSLHGGFLTGIYARASEVCSRAMAFFFSFSFSLFFPSSLQKCS